MMDLNEAIEKASKWPMFSRDDVGEALLSAARALQRVKVTLSDIEAERFPDYMDTTMIRITQNIRAAIDGPPVEKQPEDAVKRAVKRLTYLVSTRFPDTVKNCDDIIRELEASNE